MGYEEAPLTKKMDTYCLCCKHPLVEAESLELGIGPICRKKLYDTVKISAESKEEVNKLLHAMISDPTKEVIAKNIVRVEQLGFTQLAKKIIEKFKLVIVSSENGKFKIHSVYSDELVAAAHQHRGFFDPQDKSWSFRSREATWDVLRAAFAGQWALGPKGPFLIS